jgi:formylglycine-generating enzyme required for sulfatase activity
MGTNLGMEAKGRAQGGDSAHRFYISSPFLGLQKEREEAKKLITRQNHAYGDSYGGSPDPLVETCQGDVRTSDHYILILAERYGTRLADHGGKSVTELEFEAAVEAGLSLHAFFLGFVSDARSGIEIEPEARAALEAFRRRVSERCVPVDCSHQADGRDGWQVFSERITALAANPPRKPGGGATTNAPRARSYTPADLETWVERHQARLSEAFLGLPSVQARQVHVPLDVCLTPAGAMATEGPRLLEPQDLGPLLAAAGSHVLLLNGDSGAGKTSLAFAIARWWLAGEPGGVVRLPVLIETALAEGETVARKVGAWLEEQLGEPPAVELVAALLRERRLVPILDHVSELAPTARQRLLAALPPGLVIATSRSPNDGWKGCVLSRIEPQRIAVERLQAFFLDYLRSAGLGGALSDDDLMPAQAQLQRIVGEKPITVLLAQMFIDDLIANWEEGLLAGSVSKLMLSYVRRLDTPVDPAHRRRAGLVIHEALVQRALRVVALASHRQGKPGEPLFQPLEFSDALARSALMADEPAGLGLSREQAEALLGYLIELRLLLQPGAAVGRLRFPLDPLADHLAAAEQFERLEEQALNEGSEAWEEFLAALEQRPNVERVRMRGFLLALRDGAMEAQGKRALAMPAVVPDRLADLGFLDAEGERYRLAQLRAIERKWRLMVQKATDRGDVSDMAESSPALYLQPIQPSAKEYHSAQARDPVNRASKNSHAGDMYDVFLCHNSTDKQAAKDLGKQLIAQGLKPWLDEWNLRPGFPWQQALEEQIEKIKSAVVIIGSSGMGPWQDAELRAFLREFMRRKCPVIPVILATCKQEPKLPVFLNGMTWVDFRKPSPEPLMQLIWGITGIRADLGIDINSSQPQRLSTKVQRTALKRVDLTLQALEDQKRLEPSLQKPSWRERLAWPPENEPHASPFPGLSCFERKHAPVFFGRDLSLQRVHSSVKNLTESESGLLFIIGPSGCGKSSLLRAGLVPWLAGGEPGCWIVLDPFRPGREPFRAMAAALEKAFLAADQKAPNKGLQTAEEILGQLEELRAHSGQQDAKVVIAIDQFEELLDRRDERKEVKSTEADDFLSALAALLKAEGGRVVILATLRSDFLGNLQLHPSRLDQLAGDLIPLGPMDVDGFRQVIEGPAQRVGVRLETGLSDRLVRDTPSGDALPLLAFTLRELWNGLTDSAVLTLKQYERLGGLGGAVQLKAAEVLATSGATDEEIEALESAFVDHLVRLTSDGQVAKQPARLVALPAASRRLVGLFVEARLLVSGKGSDGEAVEIAHEALLRTWPILVNWIEIGRDTLLHRRGVRRLGEDLSDHVHVSEWQRRQAFEQLAVLASAGGSENRAVRQEAADALGELLAAGPMPEADRQNAALVLALIGHEEPLRQCLGDAAAPVALRRRAAECLGLLAKRSGDRDQRDRIAAELEGWLRSEVLDVRIEVVSEPTAVAAAREAAQRQVATQVAQARASGQLGNITEAKLRQRIREAEEQTAQQEMWAMGASPGWVEHDARLPLLQGASRGLQLAASADLPLLGSGPGRLVPMLTLTALQEGEGLRIRTEVVTPAVWRLPLPDGEQLELVVVEGREYPIGSPKEEAGRDLYPQFRQKCEGVNVEVQRTVNLKAFALVRHPLTQAQWRVVAALPRLERDINPTPGTYEARGLWESYAQPMGLAVDSVTWNDCQEWLRRLNRWLVEKWQEQGGQGEAPQLALPSESQWEAACRAGSGTPFHFGDTLDSIWANYDGNYTYGTGRKGAYRQRPVPVGFFGLVNRWGLAEMHGQLLEWCADQWHRDPLAGSTGDGSPLEDPDADLEGNQEQAFRLLRGGSWIHYPLFARAAFRNSNHPNYVNAYVGVRPGCFSPPGSLLGS